MIFTDEVLIAGGVHGIFVFFKVLQQKNVTADHYFWVIPTSYLMSSTDVIVTSVVAVRAVQTAGDWAAMIPLMLSLEIGRAHV